MLVKRRPFGKNQYGPVLSLVSDNLFASMSRYINFEFVARFA